MAGQEYWKERERHLRTLDSRKPPLKRVGRGGLNVPSWDHMLWNQETVNDDNDDDDVGDHVGDDRLRDSNYDEFGKLKYGSEMDEMEIDALKVTEEEAAGRIDSIEEAIMRESKYRVSFNVAREEKYVRELRVESTCVENEVKCDVEEAYLYSMMDFRNILKRTLKADNNEEFYIKNDALFYSLMGNLISKPPLYLPRQTMMHVLLVPTGRGVCRDGAVIYMPTKDDILEYVYYNEKKSQNSLSSFRQANKRLGEWRGIDFNTPSPSVHKKHSDLTQATASDSGNVDDAVINHEESQGIYYGEQKKNKGGGENKVEDLNGRVNRVVMGYVTSGRYSGSPCGAPSLGLCDLMRLGQMSISAAEQLLEYQGIGNVGSRSPPRGRVLSLVMFMSPRSKWLRPALLDVISVVP